MKILPLTLQRLPFEVMVTGEKNLEFRYPTPWILARLKNDYDVIKFVNGYGNDKPYFIADLDFWYMQNGSDQFTYSNGLFVKVPTGTVVIKLGEILKTGNLPAAVADKVKPTAKFSIEI